MLDYIALGLLFFVAIVLFYGVIAIHDIPYEIAKARKHPQQDALHVAGWISLFTLHTIWPFLWIWATLYREDRGWGFLQEDPQKSKMNELEAQFLTIQSQLTLNTKQLDKIQIIENQLQALTQRVTTRDSEFTDRLTQLANEIAHIKTTALDKKD